MYYRILFLLACGLIFWTTCERELPPAPLALLPPGAFAEQLLTTDPEEGYFERLGKEDMLLQYATIADSLVDLGDYKKWLKNIILAWPATEGDRIYDLAAKGYRAIEERFPAMLPDSVYLVLVDDLPYGPHIYFTRQNAIFVPKSEVETAKDEAIYSVLLHEYFHLLSRYNPGLRPQLYTLANFGAVEEPLGRDSLGDLLLLTNPDAPNYDYALQYEGAAYLPVLFAREDARNFTEAIDFAYYKVDEKSQTVSTQRLADYKINEATEANSAYLIHPEEILAEHFSLLFSAHTDLIYPDELQDLALILQEASKGGKAQ